MSMWYYAKSGQQNGPITRAELESRVTRGELAPDDLVWSEGMAGWQSARDMEGLQWPSPPPLMQPHAVHQLASFPVAVLILLHFFTLGIFSMVWLNLMHGRLPRIRQDDPSAARAIGFCFIPLFNLYWIFFTYRRLCVRLDEQRGLYGLPPSNLKGLATAACIFRIIPYLNVLLGFTILTPVFIGMVQSSVNTLVKTSATTSPRSNLAVQALPPAPMSGCAIAAILSLAIIPVIAILSAIALPAFVKAREVSQRNMCRANMKQLQCAKEQYALEHNSKKDESLTEQNISEFIPGGVSRLACPKGGRYTINPLDIDPECSEHGPLSEGRVER